MSIKSDLKKGIIINFFTTYSNIVIQIILSMILARLLSPKEFGVVAIVLVFVTFFQLLSDMGLGPAIIQNNDLDEKDISNIFIFSLVMGAIASLAFYFGSDLIAIFYNDLIYIKIGKLLSISIFFFTLNIVPLALNRRKHKFKLVGIITIFVNLFSGIMAIIMAYKGYSYYAIIYRTIVNSILIFIFSFYFSKLKIYYTFNIKSIKKVFSYSVYQFLFNTINYFSRNLDNILIGKYLGVVSLGFYDKAYRLMLYPVQSLTGVITPVMHPILSKYQNDKKLIFSTYLKVVKILALLGIPISIFLYFSTKEIIIIMYGEGWIESIPVFKILACTVWIQVILSSSGSIFQAAGKTKHLFISGFLSAIMMVSGIVYGVSRGDLKSVGLGLLVAFLVNFIQAYYILIKITLKQSLKEFYKVLLNPAIIGIIMLVFFNMINIEIDNIFISFGIKVLVAIISMGIGLILTKEYKNIRRK